MTGQTREGRTIFMKTTEVVICNPARTAIGTYGIATLCIGGGQGIALALETV